MCVCVCVRVRVRERNCDFFEREREIGVIVFEPQNVQIIRENVQEKVCNGTFLSYLLKTIFTFKTKQNKFQDKMILFRVIR